MVLKNKPQLLYDASVIRNERADYHNTAERVGVMFVDLINSIDLTVDGLPAIVESEVQRILGGFTDFNIDLSGYLTINAAKLTYQPIGDYLTEHQDISHLLSSLDAQKTYLTIAAAEEGWVTVDTEQTVTGAKRFTQALTLGTDAGSVTLEYRDGGLFVDGHVLSSGEVTAYASGDGAGGGMSLGALSDVSLSGVRDGYGLIYRDGRWVAEAVSSGGIDESELAAYLSRNNYLTAAALSGYATQSWVEAKGYLTQHQSLANYVTLDTAQTITAQKNFTVEQHFSVASLGAYTDPLPNVGCGIKSSAPIAATKFVLAGGTASQVLMADGSIQMHWKAVNITTATADSGFITPLGMNQWTSRTFVKKAGDTMSGTLTLPKLIIGSAAGENYNRAITAYGTGIANGDGSYSQYLNLGRDGRGGNTLQLWHKYVSDNSADNAIGLNFFDKSGLNITYGGVATLFGNTLWHAGNDGAGSGLDADTLDGYDSTSFVRSFWTSSPGHDANTYNWSPIITFTYANNAPSTGVLVDLVTRGYGVMFNTLYLSDAPLYYRRHGTSNDGGMGAWQRLARVTDNVASATRLQTARSLWGNSFDGTADVSGLIKIDGSNAVGSYPGVRFHIPNVNWAWLYMNSSEVRLGNGSAQDSGFFPFHCGSFTADGSILATGEVTAYSDARLKREIAAVEGGSRLRPVSYVKDGRRQVGLIAQEVMECCPTAVHEGGEYLALNYSSALTYALAGVYSELDAHDGEIRRLKKQVATLKKEVKRLKQERV